MSIKENSSILQSCISDSAVAQIRFNYSDYYEMLFPLTTSNELFISVVDRDFILDGYTVRKISDIESIKEITQTYLTIHARIGNLKKLNPPKINISNFRSLFVDTIKSGENIIIEGFSPNSEKQFFFIGKALATSENALKFIPFDGGGNWSETPLTIPYSSISAITLRSSYIKAYSRYIATHSEQSNKKQKK